MNEDKSDAYHTGGSVDNEQLVKANVPLDKPDLRAENVLVEDEHKSYKS